MVAYSFRPQFAESIERKIKRQTVRGERNRHARPGEAMQLYTAMRTKHCRKLLTPDPICLDVRHVAITIESMRSEIITSIEIEGISLNPDEIEAFAVADGFGSALADGFARRRMGEFWLRYHEWMTFIGVVIRWEPV